MAIRGRYEAQTSQYGLHFDREVLSAPNTGRVGDFV